MSGYVILDKDVFDELVRLTQVIRETPTMILNDCDNSPERELLDDVAKHLQILLDSASEDITSVLLDLECKLQVYNDPKFIGGGLYTQIESLVHYPDGHSEPYDPNKSNI